MHVRQTAALLLLIMFTPPAVPQATGTDTEPADAYSIYSLLIPKHLKGSHFDRYAIAQQTVMKGWQISPVGDRPAKDVRDCVRVPNDGAAEYESAISDFERKNHSSTLLQGQFVLDKPYWLLDEAEVQSYRTRLLAVWGFAPKEYQPDHRFDGGSTLVSASRVGFSSDGSVAIVYVEDFCGSTCGGGSLHVLHKVDGQWTDERNRLSCGAWNS